MKHFYSTAMRPLMFFILFLVAMPAFATSFMSKDTIFNQTDKQGLKQGFWKVKYDNGTLKYTAFFKDDKPIGEMRRYFEDSTIKAIMIFDKTSSRSKAKLYYQEGPLAAEGNYMGTAKDSTWNYYSYYTKTLSNRETYVNGRKNGLSVSYYSNGVVAEEVQWDNGVRNGFWHQYFENGVMKMSATFVNGKRLGDFMIYYPDTHIEWKGYYENDVREGNWIYYNPEGGVEVTIKYKNGEALNKAELDAKEQEILKQIENQKGKIPEPDETNFLNQPSK